MIRCSATTNKAIRCKLSALEGKDYCALHQKIIINASDISENEDPWLPKEIWQIIAADFTVLELRNLFLTCKTLYGLFTSNEWYVHYKRYLAIINPSGLILANPITEQDEMSVRARCDSVDTDLIIFDGRELISGHIAHERTTRPLIWLVDSYTSFKLFFGLVMKEDIIMDTKAGELKEKLINISLHKIARGIIFINEMTILKFYRDPNENPSFRIEEIVHIMKKLINILSENRKFVYSFIPMVTSSLVLEVTIFRMKIPKIVSVK